jgi:CheY-like chemotaxis protein
MPRLSAPIFQHPERFSHEGVGRPAPHNQDRSAVRVLVVDDSEVFQQVVCSVVDETPGFEVVGVASSGAEALELLARLDVEFVLLDRAMPGMDGIETAHRIHERHPDVVSLVLSATPSHRSVGVRSLAIEDKRNLTPEWVAAYWQRRGGRRRAPA